jgi:large conductance mechanosensitive channel
MWGEFKAFLTKTNALALAIAIILGIALGAVVKSLVDDVIMPPIGLLFGGVDFASLQIVLKEASGDQPAVAIRYGAFINTVITFIIVAFVVFLIARWFIKPEPDAPTKTCPFCKEGNALDATRCRFCTQPI